MIILKFILSHVLEWNQIWNVTFKGFLKVAQLAKSKI